MFKDQIIVPVIIQFLNTIGIPVIEQSLHDTTFLPGIKVHAGTLIIDPNRLKYPGDLLHEAGHIAVTTPTKRPLIDTNKTNSNWPSNGDEIAAILWSYAACIHLQLDINIVFHENGYKNESNWLIKQFNNKNFIGLPLLEWMGFCKKETFPKMDKWLR